MLVLRKKSRWVLQLVDGWIDRIGECTLLPNYCHYYSHLCSDLFFFQSPALTFVLAECYRSMAHGSAREWTAQPWLEAGQVAPKKKTTGSWPLALLWAWESETDWRLLASLFHNSVSVRGSTNHFFHAHLHLNCSPHKKNQYRLEKYISNYCIKENSLQVSSSNLPMSRTLNHWYGKQRS
jgi:hypothetical protein